MKTFLPVLCWLLPVMALSQARDSFSTKSIIPDSTKIVAGPDILSGGFIDIVQSGQMSASARLFKLYIGEPGKFQLPFSIYTGVSANNFSANQFSDDIILSLISPGNGFFNMSVDGINRITGKGITSLQLQYQAGLRFLSFYSQLNSDKVIFFNFISGMGLTIVTGAWEKNKVNNLGSFWFNFRGLYSASPAYILNTFFTVPVQHNILGCSGGMGVEISRTLNVKIFSFHFLNNRHIPSFSQSHLQLSFNYSMN